MKKFYYLTLEDNFLCEGISEEISQEISGKDEEKSFEDEKVHTCNFLFNTKEINLHHATSQIDLKSEQIFYLISNDDDMEELRVFIT